MKNENKKIDLMITFVPLGVVIGLSVLFFFLPDKSNEALGRIRSLFGDTFGTLYLIAGLAIFVFSIFLSLSKYGDITLGEKGEKPKYSFFTWGSMMFTCGLAADILFYSFSEWVMYASDPHISELGSIQEWAGVFPLFHWSFIPWSFYLVLACAFGFMLHIRKKERQRYSEACRALLGKKTDGILGRIIDLAAVFSLIAGTATTFSIATPLMSSIVEELLNVNINRNTVTLIILVITCIIYTYSLLHGMKGISILAKLCIGSFFGLMAYVFFLGGNGRYILDTAFESFGRMIQNFVGLSTYTDPNRTTSFPQNWTIYYWAYWMVWCVAAPFFIGNISRGRTIRQIISGGYVFGVGATVLSFSVFGNYSMGLQTSGKADFVSEYSADGDAYGLIINILKTLPCSELVMGVVLAVMIAFYATSFDSIALTASCYSYRKLPYGKQPDKAVELMWCILLIMLPSALVYSDSSMTNLQSVSIIAAFPISIIIILIILSFVKDAGSFLNNDR